MRRSAPSAVGQILPRAIPGLAEHLLEQDIKRDWHRVVGPDVARRCQPGALAGECLHVVVDNSPWLQEMTLRTPEIVSALRARFGDRVRTLRVTLGTVSREKTREARPAAALRARLTSTDHAVIDEMLTGVSDPSLAASMRRVLVKWRRSAPPDKMVNGSEVT